MPKYEVTARCRATLIERWLVEAASADEARAIFDKGDKSDEWASVLFLEQEELADQHDREVVRVIEYRTAPSGSMR